MAFENRSGIDSVQGWVVVFAAFLAAFVVFGISYTFGIFLKPIEEELHVTHAALSTVFSTMTVISFFLSPFTGRIADRHGPRRVVACGAVLMCAGLVATARVPSFPLLFLTYGVGLGGAVACTYIPAIATVGGWFKVRRVIALGVAVSGIGCGTLLAAPVSAMLIERYGWRPAIEILGWVGGGLMVVSALLLFRPPVLEEKAKVAIGPKLRTRAFALLYGSFFLKGIAVYVALVFIPAYAMDLGATRVAAASLVGYIGASSVVGRLGGSMLAPRFGLFNMYKLAFAILFVSYFLWITGHVYPTLVIFSLIMGVGYGGVAGMAPAVTASLFGVQGLGQLLGVLFTALGMACLVGPPIAGLVIDYSHTYHSTPFYAAAAAALALIVAIPLHKLEPETATLSSQPIEVSMLYRHHW